jgi:hypothetical protein
MIRIYFALLLVLCGCSQQSPPQGNVANVPAAPPAVGSPEWAKGIGSALAKDKADEEAFKNKLKGDKTPIIEIAIEKMRNAVASQFGTETSKAAAITADLSGIKEFGEEKWEVTGNYKGMDDKDKAMEASWTATIELMFGKLQCTNVKLGKRTY